MAGELSCTYPTGNTLYAHLFNSNGQIYNGSSFESPQDANYGNYDIAAPEKENTGIYEANMPASTAGIYSFVFRLQAGASPAAGDLSVGSESIDWDGSNEVALTTTIADSIVADGSRPTLLQALLMLTRFLFERSVSGTTVTVTKEDGNTSSMTFTLSDASDPTSITRAT